MNCGYHGMYNSFYRFHSFSTFKFFLVSRLLHARTLVVLSFKGFALVHLAFKVSEVCYMTSM